MFKRLKRFWHGTPRETISERRRRMYGIAPKISTRGIPR